MIVLILGMASCVRCGSGFVSNEGIGVGSIQCNACPSGYFAEFSGQAICSECPTGRFNSKLLYYK